MGSRDRLIDPSMQPIVESGKKCKHLPIIIVLSFLLVASLGFVGYEFWQNIRQQDEISALKAENSKTEESKATEEKPAPEETAGKPALENIEDSSNYINFNGAGVIIKKPEDVIGFSYLIDISSRTLYMWGTIYLEGDQAVGDGALYDANGLIKAPFLAKIYGDIEPEKNLNTGEIIGSRDKLCSLQKGTYILDTDFKLENKSFSYYQALCFKETDNLSEYYSNMDIRIQPTLERLKEHFLNPENYIKQ